MSGQAIGESFFGKGGFEVIPDPDGHGREIRRVTPRPSWKWKVTSESMAALIWSAIAETARVDGREAGPVGIRRAASGTWTVSFNAHPAEVNRIKSAIQPMCQSLFQHVLAARDVAEAKQQAEGKSALAEALNDLLREG